MHQIWALNGFALLCIKVYVLLVANSAPKLYLGKWRLFCVFEKFEGKIFDFKFAGGTSGFKSGGGVLRS